MSESDEGPGEFWPEVADLDSPPGTPDPTGDRYEADHLGEYKVQGPYGDHPSVTIGAPALRKLFVVPGDKVRVHEHPHGLLVVPTGEHVDPESSRLEEDADELDDITGPTGPDEKENEDGLTWGLTAPSPDKESGPIPPEVPWSEMVAYRCRHCKNDCINHESLEHAQLGECRFCHGVWGDTENGELGNVKRGSGD